MIQPFIPSVITRGETSIIIINDQFTHAVRKVPQTGEFRVQSEFGGQYQLITPEPEAISVAEQAVRALAHDHAPLAYARVDLMEDSNGSHVVGEVELVEADLFLALHPPAAHQLANTLIRIGERNN